MCVQVMDGNVGQLKEPGGNGMGDERKRVHVKGDTGSFGTL